MTGRKINISDAMLSGPVLKTAMKLATCVTLFGLMSWNAAVCEKDKGVDCLISYHRARACGFIFIMPIPWRYRSAPTIRDPRRSSMPGRAGVDVGVVQAAGSRPVFAVSRLI